MTRHGRLITIGRRLLVDCDGRVPHRHTRDVTDNSGTDNDLVDIAFATAP